MKSIEQAKEDIAILIPHLRESAKDALERAKPGARVQFAVIAKNPDGTGQVGACFDCDEFLSDMEAVFPPTENMRLDAAAACLLSKVPGMK